MCWHNDSCSTVHMQSYKSTSWRSMSCKKSEHIQDVWLCNARTRGMRSTMMSGSCLAYAWPLGNTALCRPAALGTLGLDCMAQEP